MTEMFEATYDGVSLKLDKPLAVPPNTRVRIFVEMEPTPEYLAKLDADYKEMAAYEATNPYAQDWVEELVGAESDVAR